MNTLDSTNAWYKHWHNAFPIANFDRHKELIWRLLQMFDMDKFILFQTSFGFKSRDLFLEGPSNLFNGSV